MLITISPNIVIINNSAIVKFLQAMLESIFYFADPLIYFSLLQIYVNKAQ